jgi:hypothetical protein
VKEIISLTVITGLLFLIALSTLVFGFIRKNRNLKLTSLFFIIAFFALAGWTGYRVARKSYTTISKSFTPRTGDEIYDALFDRRKFDCVKVLNKQDQVVPKIDYAIWLEFETCPEELKRILSQHEFVSEKISTTGLEADGPSANEKWFNPSGLGDSILVFRYKKDEYGNGQTIYSSLDSTKAFCIDILD